VSESTVRIEEPDPLDARVTLVGFREAAGPEEDTETDRLTVPAKPL
jgi:hypothetical protein